MDEKSMAKADFITSIILTAFGISAFMMALQMPTLADKGQGPYAAPGLVPGFLATIITLLGFSMLLRSIKRKGYANLQVQGATKRFFQEESTRRMGLTILLCLLYGFALGRINFTLATFLFTFVFVLCFEYDKTKRIAEQKKMLFWALVLSIIASVSIAGVFQYLFLVNLP